MDSVFFQHVTDLPYESSINLQTLGGVFLQFLQQFMNKECTCFIRMTVFPWCLRWIWHQYSNWIFSLRNSEFLECVTFIHFAFLWFQCCLEASRFSSCLSLEQGRNLLRTVFLLNPDIWWWFDYLISDWWFSKNVSTADVHTRHQVVSVGGALRECRPFLTLALQEDTLNGSLISTSY